VDADGEPEVVTDLYTGGAHCCDISRILRWDGARYVAIDHDWATAATGSRIWTPTGAASS
jgi:hypothetical protein